MFSSYLNSYILLWFLVPGSLLLALYLNLYTDCVGCFNSQSGVCLLNPDDTCKLFNKSQCNAKGPPWKWSNTSLNAWPTGCLSIVEAVGLPCGGLLPMCPEDNYYLPHANTAQLCGKRAHANDIKIFGYDGLAAGDPESYNCFAIKTFNAGCVWQKWNYYAVHHSANGGILPKKTCGTSHDQL